MLPHHIKQDILDQLFTVIDPDSEIWLIGSWAQERNKEWSDIDIVIQQPHNTPLDLENLSRLQTAFEDSDIPYIVDIVDYTTTDQSFRDHAMKGAQKWN